MPSTLLINSLVNTIQVGSMYALMALGITLTMRVIKLPNFAHAEYITVGAFTALIVSMGISTNPLIILGAAFIAGAVVAWLSHQLVFKSLEKQSASFYILLLASFAVGLIIRYILFLIADQYSLFDKRIQIPLEVVYRSETLILSNIFVWVVPTSIVAVILLTLLLNYTPLGREMRALANNITLARIIGISVERVKNQTWLLVGGLAGIAGALWGLNTSVSPLMGWVAILSVFAAAILGGLSSFTGTILGAYVVSFSENTIMQMLNF
ncbi:MAG: branched-chain amino acid ABC transporter permease, partial [Anaerolineae bacterium]|nr:branched-chain amino acid ABC transporter permease [Anaerolineae bacterium]